MVDADLDYVRKLIANQLITGPVLELGTGYSGATCRALVETAELRYYGTDVAAGPGVDFVADFESSRDMEVFGACGSFGSILILNVLEHTFDPIRVLDNAAGLLRPNGVLVVLTPSVWPLHNYPMDAWRILPNFYEEYAKRRGFELLTTHFEYVGFGSVSNFVNSDGTYSFPPPCPQGPRREFGRFLHRIFNTYGRSMFQPSHIAVAAVFRVERRP